MTDIKPGAALAALRIKATKTCPQCGKVFTAYKEAIYCSPSCRSKAWRIEQKKKKKK